MPSFCLKSACFLYAVTFYEYSVFTHCVRVCEVNSYKKVKKLTRLRKGSYIASAAATISIDQTADEAFD
jgi:hypothetical protein